MLTEFFQSSCERAYILVWPYAKSHISSYKYRQASDFWYLTGFEEPDSAVVLRASPLRCDAAVITTEHIIQAKMAVHAGTL